MGVDPFGAPNDPRPESPGERQQRWASNIAQIARRSGLDVTDRECLAFARFALRVTDSLDAIDQAKAAALAAKALKWWFDD